MLSIYQQKQAYLDALEDYTRGKNRIHLGLQTEMMLESLNPPILFDCSDAETRKRFQDN